MTLSSRPSAPNVSRFTALILGLVVIICVAMIGGTGYLKFQMDRAETLLAAPDAAVGSDQETFDRLRRILGYGGFLGLAQNYATKHDASGFAEMKSDIKAADDIAAHMPDKTAPETRHDLMAIVALFDNALAKINAPAADGEFTTNDLMTLYTALPILDARIASANAETRLAAQNRMQFWGMLLTLVSWCSLIIAAACAAGIYLTLRDKHAAPMRALAQSIQNMARGDMRTAIWGTERQDMIGELARSVDIARYHFSHLPDLSLLSDQGPVRMKFEGGTRSLFEAMMKAMSRDSEHIRDQTRSLTEAAQHQRDMIAAMSEKVETVLTDVLQHGKDGNTQIRQAIVDMVASAESLKNAHGHAADQLSRLIPTMQDRANGMAEIAQITGKQVAQTLQALTVSEIGLKANSELAKDTLTRLSSTADDLGERLFGAINLLQASGKVLAETTENMQAHGVAAAPQIVQAAPDTHALEPLMERLEQIASQLADMQGQISLPPPAPTVVTATGDVVAPSPAFEAALVDIKSKLENLGKIVEQQKSAAPTPQAAPVVATAQPSPAFEVALASIQHKLETLSAATAQAAAAKTAPEIMPAQPSPAFEAGLADIRRQLEALSAATAQAITAKTTPEILSAQPSPAFEAALVDIQGKLRDLSSIVDQQTTAVAKLPPEIAAVKPSPAFEAALADIQGKLGDLGKNVDKQAAALLAQHEVANDQFDMALLSGFGQLLADKVEPKFTALEQNIAQQTLALSAATFQAVGASTSEVQSRIASLGEKIGEDLAPKISKLEQNLVLQNEALSAATLQTVNSQFQQKIDALAASLNAGLGQHTRDIIDNNSALSLQARSSVADLADKLSSIAVALPTELRSGLQDDLQKLVAQIETARDAYDQIMDNRLTPKLEAIETALGQHTRNLIAETQNVAAQARMTVAELADKIGGLTQSLPPQLRAHMQQDWERLRAGVEELVDHKIEPRFFTIERAMLQQTRDIIDNASSSSLQARDSLIDMTGRLVEIAHALPHEIREHMEDDWKRVTAQMDEAKKLAEAHQAELSKPLVFPPEFDAQMKDHWHQIAAQIEGSRMEMDKAFKEQVAGRLAKFEQVVIAAHTAVAGMREDLAKPAKAAFPPELQKLMHDQWFQVTAQIEASRAGLVEAISHQIEKMESRMSGKTTPITSRSASDFATQRQIEQQTQILGELVATMGVLDAHMQQLKSEMHHVAAK